MTQFAIRTDLPKTVVGLLRRDGKKASTVETRDKYWHVLITDATPEELNRTPHIKQIASSPVGVNQS
jgi:hypothetical protein